VVNLRKYTGFVISPKDKKKFIALMTGINPLIYVQIKKGALKVQIHNYNAYKEKKTI